MVAWNREDGAVISSEGLIELVIVVLPLSKVIHHIAEVEEECGSIRPSSRDVSRHQVSHRCLSRRIIVFCRASIPNGMEHDPASCLYGCDKCIIYHIRKTHLRRSHTRGWH